ncbi:hypothetical protein DL98DRAFT_614401 [Cadophora sp. DSE1049]|nr:hypothetical protein DL98DRAFT_614401 [Cadophora sp. DSE1049]
MSQSVNGTSNGLQELPPVKVFYLCNPEDERVQATLDLLQSNHKNYGTLHHGLLFHNHLPHVLFSEYLFGAPVERLKKTYEHEIELLDAPVTGKAVVTKEIWRNSFNDKGLNSAYVQFFDQELENRNGDWKELLETFLYSGESPLIHGITGGLGHPLIHLAYAYESGIKEVATEALSLACTEYDPIHLYFDKTPADNSTFKSTSILEILSEVHSDSYFDGMFKSPGFANIFVLLEKHQEAFLRYWNTWDTSDSLASFKDTQKAAISVLVETCEKGLQHDFFVAHILTANHALRVVLQFVPEEHKVTLVRQWWMFSLLVYISQLQRTVNTGSIDAVELKGRDWKWVREQAVEGKWSMDSHFVKVIRAIENVAETWNDEDEWCLKAAVKYVEEFDGWTGFGDGPFPD